ncbi:hypothetical protein GF377_06010 [candidate division GN15 bacterium]|nr:hypothetical protein [candidate division GN15 bacterium]
MYTSIESFAKEWQELSQRTGQVMANLTDAGLNQPVADGFWTLGKIAWHLVTTFSEMCNRTGLGLTAVKEDAPMPSRAKEIADAYAKASAELLETVKSKWQDSDLQTKVDMYGEQWPNGLTLKILVLHEVHHRGQMTVLMRQAGLKVPGVMGPSKEDWAKFGMEAPQ